MYCNTQDIANVCAHSKTSTVYGILPSSTESTNYYKFVERNNKTYIIYNGDYNGYPINTGLIKALNGETKIYKGN